MKLLCKIGIHRPLKIGEFLFIDRWGCKVHLAVCPCGKTWMTDGGPWMGLKCRSIKAKEIEKMKVKAEPPFDRETLIRILKDIKKLDQEMTIEET